ncbi:MAG TPA: PQQ-binding-like beta-propeller repeat protein [Steroidobacteraceae bacterium]|jgi:polyvinyl alcohol dehydrogenase (cytochrome)|nr:PQQ-binding-like beta-propeller repeat protein [Steroidobacteraceae bacterium]
MSNIRIRIGAGAILSFAVGIGAMALAQDTSQKPSGEAVFFSRCKSCHEPATERAPTRAELAFRAPADIVTALTTGVMSPMAKGLSRPEIEAVALYLAPGQQLGSAGTDQMCTSNAPIQASASDWPALGPDEDSTRFQPNPGIKAADVPKLKVKWAFSMPGGGQPVVVGNWLFITNRSGKFYALDAKSGCVHWAVEDAASRTTPMVIRSPISPSGWATFIGVGKRVVRAFDAQSGKEIWHSESLESHIASNITGTPVVSGNQLFVPLSSGEEVYAMQPNYSCCSFRGSLAALDLKTGQKQWQTYMITAPLQPTRKNANGVQMQGPAGAPVWASPTVDAKRGLVYVVTGDSYTDATTDGADAIVAVEMKTGKVRWRNQVTANDNFIVGCSGPLKVANCPAPTGPDFDFGATPILFKHGHKQILIAGQKSGIVYGVDPDTGHSVWKTAVGAGSPLGGIEWGIGADSKYVFVPNSDIGEVFNEIARAAGAPSPAPDNAAAGKPGLFALDPFSGKVVWNTPAPSAPCHYAGDRSKDYTKGACVRAQSAAPAVMPGIVLSGTLDGWLRAYDAASGKIAWEFSTTAQTYNTVNGNPAQPGGGIDGMGPTIAGGMVYTMSGFNGAARTGSNGINVLLAFSVDGK